LTHHLLLLLLSLFCRLHPDEDSAESFTDSVIYCCFVLVNFLDDGVMEDWSQQGLWHLDLQPCHASLTTLVADHNCITRLDNLAVCSQLQKV
jgi:hypothetical protein